MLKKRVTTQTKSDPIDAATVALWRDRRSSISNKLAGQEQSEWAWLWRTRLSVLDYLIHRYDTEQETKAHRKKATSPRGTEGRIEAGTVREESTSPYNQPPTEGLPWIADSKKELIQNRLASLQSTNARRHAKAEQLADELREKVRSWQRSLELKGLEQVRLAEALRNTAGATGQPRTPANEGEPDQLRLTEALNELDEREYKELRRYVAFDLGLLEYTDKPLDEDTIRMILSEHGIEPDEAG